MSNHRPVSGSPGDERGRHDPVELPDELRSVDAELRAMARADDVQPPAGLASRISQAMEQEAALSGPAVFLQAARGRSGRGMVMGLSTSARSVFARGVPVMARLQAALLVVVAAAVLATGATVAATGAQAVIGVVQGGPVSPEEATRPPADPAGSPGVEPSRSPGASPSGSPTSPAPSPVPSASASGLPSVSPGPSPSASGVALPSGGAPASGETSPGAQDSPSPAQGSADLVPAPSPEP